MDHKFRTVKVGQDKTGKFMIIAPMTECAIQKLSQFDPSLTRFSEVNLYEHRGDAVDNIECELCHARLVKVQKWEKYRHTSNSNIMGGVELSLGFYFTPTSAALSCIKR